MPFSTLMNDNIALLKKGGTRHEGLLVIEAGDLIERHMSKIRASMKPSRAFPAGRRKRCDDRFHSHFYN